MTTEPNRADTGASVGYGDLVSGIAGLLEAARRAATRSVNSMLAASYWEIGRRIVEFEQRGEARAIYGKELLVRLGYDLSKSYGRGFAWRNLYQMRTFYLGWEILQTPSAKFEFRVKISAESLIRQTPSGQSGLMPVEAFPLSWSQYVRLMSVKHPEARAFYEVEAIRGGWSVRQLDRQISTQFFERVLRSKQPEALIARGRTTRELDSEPAAAEIRDPYLLEFLDLKDEYGEGDLEDALIRNLERFLLELGAGFTFVARQKRIRIGDSWFRIDLLLYHRGLRCLVIIDLKTGAFTHADAGQMNLYLNYARERLMMPGEAEPVGIILCADKDEAVVRYATGGIAARVFASQYLTNLPDAETLRAQIMNTQRAIRLHPPTPRSGHT